MAQNFHNKFPIFCSLSQFATSHSTKDNLFDGGGEEFETVEDERRNKYWNLRKIETLYCQTFEASAGSVRQIPSVKQDQKISIIIHHEHHHRHHIAWCM